MTRVIGFSAAIMFATGVAIAAQHPGPTHSAGHSPAKHSTSSRALPQDMCDSPEQPAGGHHVTLATALGLSAEQLSAVHRISTEACAAMARYHEQIHAVLTAEQRAKMRELHGGADHDDKAKHAKSKHRGK